MAVNRGWGVRENGAIGTTAKEFRLSLAGLFAETTPGVPRSGLLEPTTGTIVTGTGGWTYSVAACNPVINRTAAEGVYMPTLAGATLTGAVSAAPGTGFRYDLIWVKQNDTDKGDPDNLALIGVTEGAPSPSPAKPYGTVPAGALVLAESLIAAGATSTSHANVTITQVFPYAALRGTPIPVRTVTERDVLTAVDGDQVRRLDLDDMIETRQNGAWESGRPQYVPSGNFKTGWTRLTSTGASTPKLWSPDGNTVILSGAVKFNAGASGDILTVPAGFTAADSGGITYLGSVQASNGAVDPVNGASVELLLEGGVVKVGYQTKSLAVGSIVPLHGTWNRRAAV